MSCYALYFNNTTENIEVYPLMETHNLSKRKIEKYLENQPEIDKWVLFEHLPTEEDIKSFEEFLNDNSDDE